VTSFEGQSNPPEPTRVDIAVAIFKTIRRFEQTLEVEQAKLERMVIGLSPDQCTEYARRTGA